MIQKVYKTTDPLLKTIVSCIGYVEVTPEDEVGGWFGLYPNGTTNLSISLNDANLEYFQNSGKSILYTPPLTYEGVKRTRNLKFINLQLKPFGLFTLLGIPMQEFYSKAVSPDMVFPASECEILVEQLCEIEEMNDKCALIEQFLIRKIQPESLDDRVICAARIMKSTTTTMDALSEEVCLSNRRFRELFARHTGFSPNLYKKLMRFNRAANQLGKSPHLSLTEVAMSHDYFDQSHFIKDFKLFSGLTPSQYLSYKASSADFYNFRIPQ